MANRGKSVSKYRRLSLESLLFDAFADSRYCNPQADKHMWAIQEGLRRLGYGWQPKKAQKQHSCIRECKIEPGHTYFTISMGQVWGGELNICASCMAMILYFKEVYNLPVYAFSHWDATSGKPVNLEDKHLDHTKAAG